MSMAAVFITAQKLDSTKVSSMDEWISQSDISTQWTAMIYPHNV